MQITYKKRIKNPNNGFVSSGGGGSGGVGGGLPYTLNSNAEYVINKSLHSEGDFIAYSDGGLSTEESQIFLNDIKDVDVSTKQNGYVLTYNAISNNYTFREPQGGGIKQVFWSDVIDKPLEFNPTQHTHNFSDISGDIIAGTY